MTDRLDVTDASGLPNPADAGSGEVIASPFPEPAPISTDPSKGAKVRIGDRVFRGLAEGSGVLIVVIIAAIGAFLLWRAIPALTRNEENFFLYSGNWVTTDTSAMQFGILDLLQVTVFVSVFALLLAMPVALGIAIFLTQYAPRRVAGPLAYMVDLLAAVPSIIYGVWGLYVLAPVIKPLAMWLNQNLSWLFLFQTGNASVAGGGTIFTAGIVLAVMILPIITAVTREVFVQTPRGQIEAALALGATRWEVVKTTVLPFGLSGYISGAMLGLGRALGETIALLIILRGTQQAFGWSLFDAGLHLREQDRSCRFGIQRPIQSGRLHRGRPRPVHPDLHRQLAGAGGRRRKEQVMTATLDQPVKAPTFQKLSLRRKVADNVATVLVTLSVAIAMVPLIWVLYTVIVKGIGAVTSSTWWFNSQAGMTAFQAGGGAYHAIIGTLLQGLVCAIISIPIGVFVGIYLVEYGGGTKLGRITTFMVDILTGVPSIVAALFIYALWVATLGFQRSGFAVSLALVLLMIPVIVRSTEEMLRIVPMDLREASYALGVPKWKTISAIVIPTALSGIVTGILLALARVMGETAPLLILVGYAQAMNFDMFSGFMGSLPGMMYDQTSAGAGANPVPTDRLWGAALTLIVLIALLNVGARFIAKFFSPKKV